MRAEQQGASDPGELGMDPGRLCALPYGKDCDLGTDSDPCELATIGWQFFLVLMSPTPLK